MPDGPAEDYSKKKRGTVVNSNFNAPVDGERLVRSGLDHLVISGDGITQEVYEKYRVDGKINLVLDNLRKIVNAKKKYGSKLPYIEWQCLVTKWNEAQLDDIKMKSFSLFGITRDTLKPGSFLAIIEMRGRQA